MLCSTMRGFASARAHKALPNHMSPCRSQVRPAPVSRQLIATQAGAKAPAAVKVVLQGRKMEVTDAIKAYVEDKITRACSNFTQGLKEVDVTLSTRGGADHSTHGKREQKVEVTIRTLRHGVVRVEDTEDVLYAAIDLVCDKVKHKLTKVKEMAIAKGRWHQNASQAEASDFNDYRQEMLYETQVYDQEQALQKQFAELNKVYPSQVRRTKKVALDLMTVDEAIDAMEAVGHDFFVFREMESDSIQVVYRRRTDGYGILEPVKRE